MACHRRGDADFPGARGSTACCRITPPEQRGSTAHRLASSGHEIEAAPGQPKQGILWRPTAPADETNPFSKAEMGEAKT